MPTASDVMRVAESFLGTKESPAGSNNVVFNSHYYGHAVSGSSYPWCMAFVWDVFRLAGASDLCPKTAYCPTYESWALSKGWAVSVGQYGDVATMDFGKGRASHVGFIVSRNADGSYNTIEGNTSVTSNDNGGAVMRRTRTAANIRRIFRPAYGANMITYTKDQQRQAIAAAYKTAHNGHYHYGDSHALPPCSDHVIACDRLIALGLWNLGLTDQPRGGIVTGNMDQYLVSHGYERNRSISAVQDDDIVLMGKNGFPVPDPNYHAFYAVKVYPNGRCDKYDLGSQIRIDTPDQPFRGVRINEWDNRFFYASYRIPGGGKSSYLTQDQLEFDADTYGGLWPDLRKAFGTDAGKLLNHWHTSGQREGRRAGVLFDPRYYANKYQDVWKAFQGNWPSIFRHYHVYGAKEGRRPSELFNWVYYHDKYADLRKAFGSDRARYANHFVTHGMKEGRRGSAEFDPRAYRKRYKDLDKAFGDNWIAYYRHWVIYGKKEGRKGS